jgi:hypothetical protein
MAVVTVILNSIQDLWSKWIGSSHEAAAALPYAERRERL